EIDYEPVGDVRLPGYQPRVEGNQKQIRQAAKALAAAQRPVIYAGGGVVNANASEELIDFASSDRFPVTCTLMGLGAFPAPPRPCSRGSWSRTARPVRTPRGRTPGGAGSRAGARSTRSDTRTRRTRRSSRST